MAQVQGSGAGSLTGTGVTFQIRSAYSRIERSLLKCPQRAVLSTDIRSQGVLG